MNVSNRAGNVLRVIGRSIIIVGSAINVRLQASVGC